MSRRTPAKGCTMLENPNNIRIGVLPLTDAHAIDLVRLPIEAPARAWFVRVPSSKAPACCMLQRRSRPYQIDHDPSMKSRVSLLVVAPR